MSTVGIVIVNYNGAKYQNDCIKSLYDMDYDSFEIIVVDSGSKDNSIQMLRDVYPKVHVLEMNDNIGVAAGNNVGIKYSIELGTEYTLLLNNDVEVDKELLTILMQNADKTTAVVPKIYYYEPKDVLWYAGGELGWEKELASHRGYGKKDIGEFDEMREITYAPTCCMLIHNSIFEKVGMIDETIFMYYDDTDFCVRMYEAGIKLLYCPKAKLWHKVSSSSGGQESKITIYYMYRNQLYYMHKYRKKIKMKYRIYFMMVAAYFFVTFPWKCKNNRYILVAYIDYFLGRMGRKEFGK